MGNKISIFAEKPTESFFDVLYGINLHRIDFISGGFASCLKDRGKGMVFFVRIPSPDGSLKNRFPKELLCVRFVNFSEAFASAAETGVVTVEKGNGFCKFLRFCGFKKRLGEVSVLLNPIGSVYAPFGIFFHEWEFGKILSGKIRNSKSKFRHVVVTGKKSEFVPGGFRPFAVIIIIDSGFGCFQRNMSAGKFRAFPKGKSF